MMMYTQMTFYIKYDAPKEPNGQIMAEPTGANSVLLI